MAKIAAAKSYRKIGSSSGGVWRSVIKRRRSISIVTPSKIEKSRRGEQKTAWRMA